MPAARCPPVHPLRLSPWQSAVFLSATRAEVVGTLDAHYWRQWLTTPVNFAGALDYFASFCVASGGDRCSTIETGAHNVLTTVATQTLYCHGVRGVRSATSMKRRQEAGFLAAQMARLAGTTPRADAASGSPMRRASASFSGAMNEGPQHRRTLSG